MNNFILKLKNEKNWVAFLQFIDTPSDFFSLSAVVDNFLKINSVRSNIQIEEVDFLHGEFDTHIQSAMEINDYFSKILTYPVEYRHISPQGRVRRDNLKGDHPLYAMLTDNSTVTDIPHKNIWCEYTFVMMAAVIGYKDKLKRGEIKHGSTENLKKGMRGVRKLEFLKDNLPAYIPIPHRHLQLCDLVSECFSPLIVEACDWLNEVATMLRTFDENKEGYTRRYRSKIERVKKIQSIYLSDDDSNDEVVTEFNDILNEKSASKTHSRGLDPEELATSAGIHEGNHDNPHASISSRQQYKRMGGKRNAIIKSAQGLFYRQNTLTPKEAHVVIRALSKDPLKKRLINLYGIETLCMFGLLIFTGRSLPNLCTLRWIEKKRPKTGKYEISWDVKNEHLIIPTRVAERHNKLDDAAKAYISFACETPILERKECYEANIPEFLTELLQEHYASWRIAYKHKKFSSNDSRTTAFTDAKKIKANIDQLIEYLNNQFQLRLSERKIIRLFEQSFLKISDDQAEYVFISGERLNHGATSAHYYYTKPSILNVTHTRVINQILSYAGINSSVSAIQTELNLLESQNSNAVGSKLILNSVLMRKYVKSIKQTVADIARNEDLVQKHNHFVFYCIRLLGFATGYRAVGDPLDHISQLNKKLGLMVISDKDFDDDFHTRIVPVSNIVLKQFDLYEEHLQKLKGQLGSFPELLSEVRLLLAQQKSRLPYFFFLSEKMRFISISPEHIKKHIRPLWALPENVNRHYLRSEIMALTKSSSKFKASCECLDYFMGHWGTGEEPFNKHALVSPMQIKKEIQPVIDHILARDGWSPIKGPTL